MAQYSEEVQNLAETLKNSGLAASMTDALERAQGIIGKKEEAPVDDGPKDDVEQTTLDVDNQEPVVKESPEELNEEEVFANQPDDSSQDKQETVDNSTKSKQKIDLTDVFNVNK